MRLFSGRRDSTESQDAPSSRKSKRPPNSAFRQQRLKAWQPILSPQSVLPLLIIVAAIFAPIGIGLIITVNNVQNLSIDYSECRTLAGFSYSDIPSKYVRHNFKKKLTAEPQWKVNAVDGVTSCYLQFDIPQDIKKSVYIYYKLTNFYQNHRKYVSSFDIEQLKGNAVDADDLVSECNPLRESDGKAIYPCGLIANSLFNDTFPLVLNNTASEADNYYLTNKEISWSTDRKRYKKTKYNASQIVPPPNWSEKYPDGYTDDNIPDISTWEELQVWMRTAGLPKFYKLAAKNETSTLKKGTYEASVALHYPVDIFGGSKSFILTTNSIVGGRNMSLGIVYLIVAGIAILFGIIFVIKLIVTPRKMGDHTFLHFAEQGDESQLPASSSST
ncbi:unnamed protein product [Kluyveromyces dobzhanskii CBS 2104]|uniref:WGS project CCBQ000000000 data, contig 00009 n=1 Tax=Kluyveromyces dobzhanskii CBS 2104 TaxID=1427455 RepID=A0A0A8L5H6_9SACH|nr:unnamed protein product [Kluyveromyces dobzhanskii CBS 2104]